MTYASSFRLLAAALVGLFFYSWSNGTVLAGTGGDDATYWLTANFFSPYSEPLLPAAQVAQRSLYPPLYPWVLAIFGGGESVLSAHRITAGILLGALVVLYQCGRRLGLTANKALALVILFAGCRVTLLEGLDLHSEHLYLLLSVGAIALVINARERPVPLLLAALAVTGAYFTRTFGLTLCASFVLWLVFTHPPGGWRYGLVVIAPIVLWSAFHSGSGTYVSDLLGSYAGNSIVGQLTNNLLQLQIAWLGCFGEIGQPGFFPLVPLILAIFCVLGTVHRLRTGAFDGLYVPAYLTLLLIWPYPVEYERLLYPILPVALLQGAVGTLALSESFSRAGYAVLMALLLAAVIPFALLVQARLAAPPEDSGYQPYLRTRAWYLSDPVLAFTNLAYQRALIEALQDVRQQARVPKDACLLATKPALVALYTEVQVDGLPAFTLSNRELERVIRNGRCQYLFMMMSISPAFPQAYFPYRRIGSRLTVLAAYRSPMFGFDNPAALLAHLPP
ncbi:MAG: hypothetical protein EXR86_06940 [Gammaproteobacteria bacterium]|nr:hypothetical protein [Gammaproteobacteria bacterium]